MVAVGNSKEGCAASSGLFIDWGDWYSQKAEGEIYTLVLVSNQFVQFKNPFITAISH